MCKETYNFFDPTNRSRPTIIITGIILVSGFVFASAA